MGRRSEKPQMGWTDGQLDGWTDGQTKTKPLVLCGETGRGLINEAHFWWLSSVKFFIQSHFQSASQALDDDGISFTKSAIQHNIVIFKEILKCSVEELYSPHHSLIYQFPFAFIKYLWERYHESDASFIFKGPTHAYLDLQSITVDAYLYPLSFSQFN